MLISAISNNTLLTVLMIVLVVFVILLAVLGIVFVVALRKRAPVVKVVMAPQPEQPRPQPVPQPAETEAEPVEEEKAPEPEPEPEEDEEENVAGAEDDGEDSTFVTEGQERVRYDRSFTAKLVQLKDEAKEWYSELKNELLSYQKVHDRMSWKRETFRIGRMNVARLIIRGKTLCIMLAVEPTGYAGTKYTVEDVSSVASTADTPCLYRIKSGRRVKYAKEMLAAVMKELGVAKQPGYQAEDFFLPYEGTMGLMQRGLVKRVVSNSTRVFQVRELDKDEMAKEQEAEAAAAESKE